MKQRTRKLTIAMTDMGNSRFRRYMKGKYIKSLYALGADTRLYAWDITPQEAGQIVAECDGVLLPGGADLNPAFYGMERQDYCGASTPERDHAEEMILREALAQGKPVLGICRGCQLINCYFGGTLYQDIRTEVGAAHLNHMNPLGSAREVHHINVRPDTRLAQIAGAAQMGVNSLHHQAIREVGQGLTVAAVSEDGLVEALERPGGSFLLAVQWHPEHLFRRQQFARDIFGAFLSAC